MDALYLYRHSKHDDFEIRYSLRSIHLYAPYIRKVWIFGDRPHFLSPDTRIVECVPHSEVAWMFHTATPVRNFFLMMFLSSLIPDLDFEYLRFSDDFFLMRDFPIEEARKDRFLEDLARLRSRRGGAWGESLWRTYDLLKRLGYPTLNFEIHAPTYLTRKRVFEAYRDLRDFVTEDRWFGLVGATAILNHTLRLHPETMHLVSIEEEMSRFGYWGRSPSYEQVLADRGDHFFFNCDDEGFGDGVRRFLMECFPTPSPFEADPPVIQIPPSAEPVASGRQIHLVADWAALEASSDPVRRRRSPRLRPMLQ